MSQVAHHVCENTQYLLEVFDSIKEKIDILKTGIAQRRDIKINNNIKDATLKLDEMLVRCLSSIRAESECKKPPSTVAKAEQRKVSTSSCIEIDEL